MSTYQELLGQLEWQPIPGCPGRFRLLSDSSCAIAPAELAGHNGAPVRLISSECRDPFDLVLLSGGGALLSYLQSDGTYRHTLNTQEGLLRKLRQLGLPEEIVE